jgi:hypothetical protein
MFDSWFPKGYSTLEQLMWLHRMLKAGAAIVWTKVTGTSPLSLPDALAKPIRSLVQYGKCTTVDGDIYCNNGKLVATDDELPAGYKRLLGITFDGSFRYETGEYMTGADDVTMTLDNLSASGKNVFGSYNGANDKNFSLYIYGSSTSGSYFRYGDQLKRPKYGGTGKRTITFGKSGTTGFADDSEVTPDEFTTPANTYIGMLPNSSSAAFTGDIVGSILVSNRLEWIPCERESDGVIGYYEKYNRNFIAPTGSGTPVSLGYDTSHLNVLSVDGTPEVLTIGTQTATVQNLFEAGGVADEQDIISGVVTRRVEVTVAGGVISITALATPVTEHVTPQPLSTVEGDNTLSWTAEVSGTVKEVEYAYEAPSFEWKTASGAVVNVNDAIAGEVGALTVGINPVQNLNGYDKPWPPGGGVNLTDYSTPYVGEIGVTKQVVLFDLTLPAGTYTFSAKQSVEIPTSVRNCLIYSVTGGTSWTNETAAQNFNPADLRHKLTFTLAETTTVKFGYWNRNPSVSAIFTEWQVEAGESFTAFAPFSNICPITGHSTVDVWVEATYDPTAVPTVAVPLGGTYYGGTLDVLTGELTVTLGAVDLGSLNWSFSSSENRAYTAKSDMKNPVAGWNKIFTACSAYAIAQIGNATPTEGIGANGTTLYMRDTRFSSAEEYKAGTSGVLFVYELATPQTIQLTPAQVSTLLGTNVIWASGNGEVSVTYRAEASE